MRVLFVICPFTTIYHYAVTTGWALRTAGHDVRYACPPNFADAITQAGHTAVPMGSAYNPSRLTELVPDVTEEDRAGVGAPYEAALDPDLATWEYLRDGYAAEIGWGHKYETLPIIRELVAYARYWEPDLVIWDPLKLAGPIAAKACGAAHARLLFGLDVYGVTREHYLRLKEQQPEGQREDPLAEWLDGYARKYGSEFSEDMTTGHFTIDQFPRSLQIEASDLHYVRSQFVPYNGTSVVPRWLWEAPQRPRVALTLGNSAVNFYQGYAVNVQEILDALADLDIELVATIAEKEQAKLTRIPDNTRILPFVPLHALAPTCSAVIHHAGAGTVPTVSRYGVPQVSLPLEYDEPALADRLAATGAALTVNANHASGQVVRDALQRLIGEPSFAQAAARLGEEMRAAPSPARLVPVLEELTARHRATGG